MVPAAPPLGHQCPEHLVHERRNRERRPVLPACLEGYPQVLAVILDLAPGGEVVRQELLTLHLEDLVGGEAPGEHLYDPIGSHPGLRGQDEGLGYRLDDQRNHYLVASLDDLTGPRRSRVRLASPHPSLWRCGPTPGRGEVRRCSYRR